MMRRYFMITKVFLVLGGFFTIQSVDAQGSLDYQKPPESILELLDAPTTPAVSLSRSGKTAILYERPDYPTISDVSQPIVGLAGLRLNPLNSSSAVANAYTGFTVRNLETGVDNVVQGLPEAARIGNTSLNPEETLLAFTNSTQSGVELWIADLKTFQARKLSSRFLNDAYGSTFSWTPDGRAILAKFIPAGRGDLPKENLVPTGPVVQQNLGKEAPSRTYQNLLKNPYDESLFDHFVTSEVGYIDLQGNIDMILEPAIYSFLSFSPNGEYILARVVRKPYSYLVPAQNFANDALILDRNGNEIKKLHTYALNEGSSGGQDVVSTDPRSFSWRPDMPATIYYVQVIGDEKSQKDGVYQLEAPFTSAPVKLLETEIRFAGINFTGKSTVIVTERSRKERREVSYLFNMQTLEKLNVIKDRKTDDQYSDPGRFVNAENELNRSIVLTDPKAKQLTVFTISTGASPEGDRPFLMKWNLITGKQDTLFKSKAPYYELPVFFDNKGTFIITKESINDAPNYYSVNLRNRRLVQLTNFPDPYPPMRNVTKEIVHYKRKDGLDLSGTLYLPAGYNVSDGPLPMILWAYPREFRSMEAASQVSGSPYRFTRLSWGSPVYWVTRGYAVLDNADMPIVGVDGKEPNDTFVEQLEDNSRAAINFLAGRGIADPKRVAVGGHSYGAFMTANLLAHTDLFAAGLARSGAYNRTFTPFGFQNESRTYWEAQDIYSRMSPFSYANKIKAPILLIHGIDDENSGTFPIQSERLYNAIKGHGGTARLVFLPKEFHSYRAKESIYHTLWEMDQWLETYVKNKKD